MKKLTFIVFTLLLFNAIFVRADEKIKVIVGNNRMTAAKILGYKEVPIIINSYDPNYKPKGRELKSDDEIRALFKLGKDLQIRRNKDGMIDQIMPSWYEKVKDKYV